jgi:Leucine-rich repeat (LRR) protein
MKRLLMLSAVLLLCSLIVYAGDYDEHDLGKLRAFLSQPSAEEGKLNGAQLGLTASDMATWDDNEDWVEKVAGVQWTESSPKQIRDLRWWSFDNDNLLSGNLDLSGCTSLTDLRCFNPLQTTSDNHGHLTALNVSGCTSLINIRCEYNLLTATSLDISGCTSLRTLICDHNLLMSLDVSSCTALTSLQCDNNPLTTLDVSKLTALTALECFNTTLATLDLSHNPLLVYLACSNNQLTALDLNNNTALDALYCDNNRLTVLDLSNNALLTDLQCENNQLTILDLSNNLLLNRLRCAGNPLSALSVGGNTPLPIVGSNSDGSTYTVLSLPDISQSTLYVPIGSVPAYKAADVWKNFGNIVEIGSTPSIPINLYHAHDKSKLKAILLQPSAEVGKLNGEVLGLTLSELSTLNASEEWVSKVEGLTWSSTSPKQITDIFWANHNTLGGDLDLSGCEGLGGVICDYSSRLSGLNFSDCPKLIYLSCRGIQLTTLNLSGCPSLTTLYCDNNQLTSLDVSNHPILDLVSCHDNNLTELDVSNNPALSDLRCNNNLLTVLDVNNNSALASLECDNNQLTMLDVRTNPSLIYLGCRNNRLSTLDLSNNPSLIRLYCVGNPLTDLTAGWRTPFPSTEPNGEGGTYTYLALPDVSSATLYVPVGSIPAYRSADMWKDFKEILEIGSTSNPEPPVIEYPSDPILGEGEDIIVIDPVVDLGWSSELDASHRDYIYIGDAENTITIVFHFPQANVSGVDQLVELELGAEIVNEFEVPVGLKLSVGSSSVSVSLKLKGRSGLSTLSNSLRNMEDPALRGVITARVPVLGLESSSMELSLYDQFSYLLEYASPGINYGGYLRLNLVGGSPALQMNINGRGWVSAYPDGDYVERAYLGSELSDLSQVGSVIYLKDVNTGSSVTVIPVTTASIPVPPLYRTITLHIPDGIAVESPVSSLVIHRGEYVFKLARPSDGADSLLISLSNSGISVDLSPVITLLADTYHIVLSPVTSNLDVYISFLTSTGNASISPHSVTVSLTGDLLSVLTPYKESITLYSLRGSLLSHTSKEKGSTTINIGHLPKGVLIVRGSSGWTRKVLRQ